MFEASNVSAVIDGWSEGPALLDAPSVEELEALIAPLSDGQKIAAGVAAFVITAAVCHIWT